MSRKILVTVIIEEFEPGNEDGNPTFAIVQRAQAKTRADAEQIMSAALCEIEPDSHGEWEDFC